MSVSASIHDVFGHFQNLNLLVLMQDLRDGRTAQRDWRAGSYLCPVAHGLPEGRDVEELVTLQGVAFDNGCAQAARRLGADAAAVFRFVRRWDEEALGPDALLRQLEELWLERLEDAQAVQTLLETIPAEVACTH